MKLLKDYILGPNLETLRHRNIMLMIGNDFSFNNRTKRDYKMEFEIQDVLHYLLTNFGEQEYGVPIRVKMATASEFFGAVENEV